MLARVAVFGPWSDTLFGQYVRCISGDSHAHTAGGRGNQLSNPRRSLGIERESAQRLAPSLLQRVVS